MNIQDPYIFSRLLVSHRGNTQIQERAKLIGVSISTINNWEGVCDSVNLPKKERLPKISETYGIEIHILVQAWETSKQAMNCVNRIRRGKTSSTIATGLSGSIASRRSLARTNSQVGFHTKFRW